MEEAIDREEYYQYKAAMALLQSYGYVSISKYKYSNLCARAAELEAENKRLREALGEIIFKCGLAGMGNVSGLEITTMAQKALKGGDS